MAQRRLQLRDHFPYGPHTEDQGRRQGQKPSVGGHAALRWQCAEFSAREADTAKSPGRAAGSSQGLYRYQDELKALADREGWMAEKEVDLHQWELIGADLADAFCHFPVSREELGNCICPGLEEGQFILYTAFFSASKPHRS